MRKLHSVQNFVERVENEFNFESNFVQIELSHKRNPCTPVAQKIDRF